MLETLHSLCQLLVHLPPPTDPQISCASARLVVSAANFARGGLPAGRQPAGSGWNCELVRAKVSTQRQECSGHLAEVAVRLVWQRNRPRQR